MLCSFQGTIFYFIFSAISLLVFVDLSITYSYMLFQVLLDCLELIWNYFVKGFCFAFWYLLYLFLACNIFLKVEPSKLNSSFIFSLERRWSSRTFRYGYLVTTSPQSFVLPWAALSLRLSRWLWAPQTPMVWRAVCTRPGNAFTATFWFAITSNSDFMWASFSPQSELGLLFSGLLRLTTSLLFVTAIVARV